MSQPQMDRPRKRRGTPFSRELLRLAKLGAVIATVVIVVGSLPVLGVWWFYEEPEDGGQFGFRDEEVMFRGADGTSLFGRLRLPIGDGPFPLLVVAHGSGRARVDGYAGISETFALNGFAFMSYDKRGVGASEGVYSGVGPENSVAQLSLLAADVVAAAQAAARRDDIDTNHVGVYGVSQGGWIAPIALSQSDLLNFMVIVSGPTVSVGEEIFYSNLTGEAEGASAQGEPRQLSARLAQFEGPHGFDPMRTLERLDSPSLWVLGAADRSIPIPETVRRLEALARRGHAVEIELVREVGHGMRNVFTGAPHDPFPRIFRWLVENLGR
ncbi:MAG: prolyl oligopeptidase family serine peptidase [Acidobacteria bacterium]|nr:prolyl oligopeptidase family serine peptidase [Acidobacteriota bacterium]